MLLQSGKAADLAGAFGGAGSQTAFGPRGAATLLSQATTWCAVMFMICAMALVLRIDKAGGKATPILEKFSKPAPAKTAPATASTGSPIQSPAPAPIAPQSTTPQSNSTAGTGNAAPGVSAQAATEKAVSVA